jgi:hypothetical protein
MSWAFLLIAVVACADKVDADNHQYYVPTPDSSNPSDPGGPTGEAMRRQPGVPSAEQQIRDGLERDSNNIKRNQNPMDERERQLEQESHRLSQETMSNWAKLYGSAGHVEQLRDQVQDAVIHGNVERAVAAYEELVFGAKGDPHYSDPHFNSSNIVRPERINGGPAAPLSSYRVRAFDFEDRKEVAQVANRYQVFWAKNKGLEHLTTAQRFNYAMGLNLLQTADQTFNDNRSEAQAYLRISNSVLDFTRGMAAGAWESLKSQVKGSFKVLNLAYKDLQLLTTNQLRSDTSQIMKAMMEMYQRIPPIREWWTLALAYHENTLKNMSYYEAGKLVGHLSTDVSTFAVLQGGSSALGASEEAMQIQSAAGEFMAKAVDAGFQFETDIFATVMSMTPEYRQALAELAMREPEQAIRNLEFFKQIRASPDQALSESASFKSLVAIKNPSALMLNEGRINRYFEITRMQAAEALNAEATAKSALKSPYAKDTYGFDLVTRMESEFVRVHGPSNQEGIWLVKKDAIMDPKSGELMSAEQIKTKLSLDYIPSFISEVSVAKGTHLRRGISSTVFEGSGGTVQYQVLESPGHLRKFVVFKNSKPLK